MTQQMPPALNGRITRAAVRWIKGLRRGGLAFDARGVSARLRWYVRLSFVGLVFCGQIAVASFGFAGPSELTDPIEQLNAGLLKVMKAGKTLTFQQRYDLLAPAIIRAVNLKFIVESAAGDHWGSLPPAQQQALVETFQRYAVAMCASHFGDYAGERFELLPAAKTEKGDPVVKVKILPGNPSDDVHVLSYTMQKNGSEWQAIDVVIDGFVSFAAVKEAELRSVLWSKGAPALLIRLQQLAEALADKAASERSTK
jgi:phospholipid transport system substrate-binding protein